MLCCNERGGEQNGRQSVSLCDLRTGGEQHTSVQFLLRLGLVSDPIQSSLLFFLFLSLHSTLTLLFLHHLSTRCLSLFHSTLFSFHSGIPYVALLWSSTDWSSSLAQVWSKRSGVRSGKKRREEDVDVERRSKRRWKDEEEEGGGISEASAVKTTIHYTFLLLLPLPVSDAPVCYSVSRFCVTRSMHACDTVFSCHTLMDRNREIAYMLSSLSPSYHRFGRFFSRAPAAELASCDWRMNRPFLLCR